MPNITQYYLEVQEKRKFDILTRLLDMQSPELAIIFGRTKRRVDELSEALNMRGYSAQGIHGDLTQSKRLSVLRQFKEGSIDVLVATDVAARGLDISGVTHVYNFDIPQDPESYVHRIGRTGRAGKMGAAMTFVTPRETGQLHNIERTTKRKMERMTAPTLDEAMEGQQRIAADKLTESVTQGNLSYYKQLAEELLEEHDSVSLVAAAIKLFTKEPNESPIQLTAEPPVIAKGDKTNVEMAEVVHVLTLKTTHSKIVVETQSVLVTSVAVEATAVIIEIAIAAVIVKILAAKRNKTSLNRLVFYVLIAILLVHTMSKIKWGVH